MLNKINDENNKPLVSIITITLNLLRAERENYFNQCLESVHNQTYKNIEHIIIDGASSDGTVNIIKTYADRGWIKYISEPDKGIYNAMNKGVGKARGKYIAFLNSDDYYHKKHGVEISVKSLEESKADFSFAPIVNLDEATKKSEIIVPKISNVFFSITPCHQTMFVKREIIVQEGMFNETFRCVGDYNLTVRLCLKKYKSVFVTEAFSTYRLGGFSLEATNDGTVFKEVAKIYFENYKQLCPLTKDDAENICGDVYNANIEDVPFELANKFKEYEPYFDFNEYEVAISRKKMNFENNILYNILYNKNIFFYRKYFIRYISMILNTVLRQPAKKIWYAIRFNRMP